MFWIGKRVIITGGAGLVGASLVERLLAAGANVTVLDDFSRGRNRVDGATYVIGDAGDQHVCELAFIEADAVFNLAAYVAGVLYNQSHHAEMFTGNIRLQCAPVLAAARIGVPRFLQVSSVCVYAENRQNPCIESDIGGEPNNANAGYAWAKRMGEQIALRAGLKHCVIVRPANIYGTRDYFDERAHVIPALIKKFAIDDIVEVNGTGEEVREFLYADDAARGMMIALERGEANGVYNIGTNGADACAISELAYTIREVTGIAKPIVFTGGNGGDARRIVNGDRLRALGWGAEVALADGLKRVREWYRTLT